MDIVEFPPPPAVDPFSRTLFESPWLLAGVLGVVTLFLLVTGLREGRLDRLRQSAVPGGLLVLLLVVAHLVTTPAERARTTVRSFVEAIVAGDAATAKSLLAADLGFHVGDPDNVAFGRDYLTTTIDWATGRYAIESNSIRRLDAWTVPGDRAVVHLGCLTFPAAGGPTPSQWVLEVAEQDDGTWRIDRMTWIGVLGRRPSGAEIPVRVR